MKYILLIFIAACLVSGCVSQPDSSRVNPESVRQNAVSGQKNATVSGKNKNVSPKKNSVPVNKSAVSKSADKPQSRIGTFCGDSDVDDDF